MTLADIYRDALQTIVDGDVPRPVKIAWAAHGKPSKHDRCEHGLAMYEDCGRCVDEFVLGVLAQGIEAQRAETVEQGSVHESPVAESDAPAPYELKSCPFCGGGQVTTAPDSEFGDATWDAICKSCGARLSRDLEDQAIAAWNSRAQSPNPCDPSPNSSQDRV